MLTIWVFLFSLLLAGGGFVLLLLLYRQGVETFLESPGLDVVVAYFTWGPWLVFWWIHGWPGLIACALAQVLSLLCLSGIHTFMSKRQRKPGALRKTLGEVLGTGRVVTGFLITLLAIPVFLFLRLGQVTVYPLLSLCLGFPRYRSSDWIRLSRHKFDGLVGLDLAWCLYCEWAAGVYALGGEMVRNNESFWCPIRFASDKHCENCRVDFPDIDRWISQKTGRLEDVSQLLSHQYQKGSDRPRSWYGHPDRKGE